MAFDTYMKIEGVTGEATATGMEGQIEVFSWSFGASNPTTVGPGKGGLSAGRVSISSFNVMKKTESSSPTLFTNCCKGKDFGSVIVTMRKAGGAAGQKAFLIYTFTNVMVESIQWSGSSGGDDTPTESVSFAFSKVDISYQKQDTKGGAIGNPILANWDLTTVAST